MGLLCGINEPSEGPSCFRKQSQKMDTGLKAYYHHDNKIPNSAISFMKLITEDWQQQQQEDRRLTCKIFNS